MPDARPAPRAPWIIAGVAGVVFVVLLVVYFVPLSHARNSYVPGQLTTDEQRAVNAAATETVNILSYSRKDFQADYQRALAGSTGALAKDITSKKASYLQTLTQNKFDTSASITNQALAGTSPTGQGFVVLLTINSVNSNAPGTPIPYHLQVTVVEKNGKYLASDLQMIGVS